MFSFITSTLATISFVSYGLRKFTRKGFERASTSFQPIRLPADVKDKVMLVTGANSGLGRQIALELARCGAQVHMVCRSRDRGLEAQQFIQTETANPNVYLHIADMSSLHSILQFSSEFSATQSRLDCLVNNAGILPNERSFSADGIESTFATNTLGPYLLTRSLLPLMQKTQKQFKVAPKVVTVSSGGAYTAKLNSDPSWWTNLNDTSPFDGQAVYSQTKRQELVFTRYFARNHNPDILFFAVHPGWSDTPGVRTSIAKFYETFQAQFRSVEQGADGIIWLAISEDVPQQSNGGFWLDRHEAPLHLPLAFTKESEEDARLFIDNIESLLAQKVPNVKI